MPSALVDPVERSKQLKRLRRHSTRSDAPRCELADQIARMKVALFCALDTGENTEIRASGNAFCCVCGDELRHHPQPLPDTCPTIVGTCSGQRYKL